MLLAFFRKSLNPPCAPFMAASFHGRPRRSTTHSAFLCRAQGGRDGSGPACSLARSLHLGGPRLPRRRRCSLRLWSLRADSEFTPSCCGCSSFSSCIYVIVVRGLDGACVRVRASVTMHSSVEYRRTAAAADRAGSVIGHAISASPPSPCYE